MRSLGVTWIIEVWASLLTCKGLMTVTGTLNRAPLHRAAESYPQTSAKCSPGGRLDGSTWTSQDGGGVS